MDIYITQIAQQVSHLSQPPGLLLGQPKTNPIGHINAIFAMKEGLEEGPVMVLQEIIPVPNSAGTDGRKD